MISNCSCHIFNRNTGKLGDIFTLIHCIVEHWNIKNEKKKLHVFHLKIMTLPLCSSDKVLSNRSNSCYFSSLSVFLLFKQCFSVTEWNKQLALCHVSIYLQCDTYNTKDAPLPEVEEAVLEGWYKPCARCDGIHPTQSVWCPLAVHCQSDLEEKNTLIIF